MKVLENMIPCQESAAQDKAAKICAMQLGYRYFQPTVAESLGAMIGGFLPPVTKPYIEHEPYGLHSDPIKSTGNVFDAKSFSQWV